MAVRSELRKEAYAYFLNLLNELPAEEGNKEWLECVSLDELRLVKEGKADPSPSLVALIKEILNGTISDEVIDSHLVTPFKNKKSE
jgi:hypothetical protein